jgi:hypothetical protein
VGEKGRLPPGESWQRAMDEVNRRLADGSMRRYRVRGRRIEKDWWAYDVAALSKNSPPVKKGGPPTREQVARLSQQMPRCAQRARARHGGDSKVAWPTQRLAFEVASVTGGQVYRCQLPAPAIGEHWHITTRKKRKRWM